MTDKLQFDAARRRLDALLSSLADEPAALEEGAEASPPHLEPPPAAPQGGSAAPVSAVPATEALTRLVAGAALLGLDAIAARTPAWERAAGIERPAPQPAPEPDQLARFRHGLIGWVFEAEEELRPHGNPLRWVRGVAGHLFGTGFSVVLDALPRRPRPGEPADQETARWAARGRLEERRSRAFAQAALADALGQAIPLLARQPGVQTAIAELVRSPAMDDAIVALARQPGVQTAIAELVRSPAVEGALTHIVATQAMDDAIETLAESPALVALVQAQSTTVAGAILGEVREHSVSADLAAEGLARRLLGRPSRARLTPDEQGLVVREPIRRP